VSKAEAATGRHSGRGTLTLDPRFPTPQFDWIPAPPYEFVEGPPRLWRYCAQFAVAFGACGPLMVLYIALEDPSLSVTASPPNPIFILLFLLGIVVANQFALRVFEYWIPTPVVRLGISPAGIVIESQGSSLASPWSRAAVLGDRLVVVPPGPGWLRTFALSHAQADRVHFIHPAAA
jgi:hypothetical protein